MGLDFEGEWDADADGDIDVDCMGDVYGDCDFGLDVDRVWGMGRCVWIWIGVCIENVGEREGRWMCMLRVGMSGCGWGGGLGGVL